MEIQKELEERTKSFNDIKQKEERREREVQDLYSSLG